MPETLIIGEKRAPRGHRVAAGMVGASLLLLAAAAQAGPSVPAKCEARKNKEAGQYAFCVEKARMKLLQTSGTCSIATSTTCYRDAECPSGETCTKDLTQYDQLVMKCDAKFTDHWGKAELKASGSCPTSGDESSLHAQLTTDARRTAWRLSGTPRFADNGDGTITDQQTGLMWEKQVAFDSTANNANLEDADNYYYWAGTCSSNASKYCQPSAAAAASCAAGVEGDPTGCDVCAGGDGVCTVFSSGTTIWEWLNQLNGAAFAGYSDWRVPTLSELESIVDLTAASPAVGMAFQGASCGGACTDITDPACSCTATTTYYGSASTYAALPLSVWFLPFDSGGELFGSGTDKLEGTHARAVRGGP